MAIERIGIAGAGFMGRGIVSALLGVGYNVNFFAPGGEEEAFSALQQIELDLNDMATHGVCSKAVLVDWRDRCQSGTSVEVLAPADFVIESVIEDIEAKQRLYDQLEETVGPKVTIASNSSAIPATEVQHSRKHPERFLSMHWGEPAYNRFMEITPGPLTDPKSVKQAVEIATRCKKDPCLLKKDIRGFVLNRLMYATFREAFYLLESGVADVEMIDRAFQNDVGWYATIAGPFRLMDITGIPAYAAVMKDLFPELSRTTHVPKTMEQLIEAGADGIKNGRGFYQYTPEEAADWKRKWEEFGLDIRELAEKHMPLEKDGIDS